MSNIEQIGPPPHGVVSEFGPFTKAPLPPFLYSHLFMLPKYSINERAYYH